MTHGARDDSNVRSGEGLQRLDDLGELAARMGSIVNYSRSGSVFLTDDFEGGLDKWRTKTGPAGGEVVVDNSRTFGSRVSCRLLTGVGVDPYAYIGKWMPIPPISRLGLAASVSIDDDMEYLHWEINFAEGIVSYAYRVQYWRTTGILTYNDPLWGFIPFGEPGLMDDDTPSFHNGKLVVDMTSKEYVRFEFDNVAYDLTGYLGPTNVFDGILLSEFVIYAEAVNPGPANAWVDNLVLTFNEI